MTTFPPIETLANIAADLASVAHEAGDKRSENAINKAIFHLQNGLTVTPTTGGYLVPSGTKTGIIYRVSTTHGCNCEAGQAGQPCWHDRVAEIITTAEERVVRTVSYDEAMAAVAELFA
jgi:hypothetical protein